MLTRLQVDGFKNLREVDLRFGPLTCIAGRNGVGKKLCDAITFLRDLSSMPLLKAATQVRGSGGRLSLSSASLSSNRTASRDCASILLACSHDSALSLLALAAILVPSNVIAPNFKHFISCVHHPA